MFGVRCRMLAVWRQGARGNEKLAHPSLSKIPTRSSIGILRLMCLCGCVEYAKTVESLGTEMVWDLVVGRCKDDEGNRRRTMRKSRIIYGGGGLCDTGRQGRTY